MAANVIFKLLTAAQWEALENKDNGTIYRVQKSGGGEDFYQGSNKLNNAAEISAAVAALTGSATIASASEGVVTLKAGITEADGIVSNSSGSDITLAKVATTGAAEDVAIADAGGYFTSDDVEGALTELAQASSGGVASKTIWFTDNSAGQSDYAKVYKIWQGANSPDHATDPATLKGTINIPKDEVLQDASIVTITFDDGHLYDGLTDVTTLIVGPSGTATSADAGKYMKFIIQNVTNPLYVNLSDFIDIYTVEQNATQIQLAIDANNEISATVVAGSIDTTELAAGAVTTAKLDDEAVTTAKIDDDAVTTAKIADENVTLDKLASGVQTSLGLADSAVQSVTASDPTTGTNGTITVDGTEVAVKGLGSAAYTASSDYDVAGSAASAITTAEAYADGLLTWQTVE